MKYLHAMVRVRDLDASLHFFRDALGLVETRRNDYPQGRFTLVYLAAPGNPEVEVLRSRQEDESEAALLVLVAPHLAHAELAAVEVERRVDVTDADHGVQVFHATSLAQRGRGTPASDRRRLRATCRARP